MNDERGRKAAGRRTGAPRPLRGSRLRAFGVILGIPLLLLAASFALPVRVWRTGELPAAQLPVVAGGPVVELADRVWVDTDAACGAAAATDVDDCLALALLAGSPERRIVGVSTVHGNAPLAVTDRTVRQLVAAVAWPGGAAPAVVRGAAGALEPATQGLQAPATAALRRALAEGPLTLLALGPLTNVAAALDGRPDLQRNVRRLVAVMGRRPGHLFHPAEGRGHGMLFGHGPVFSDLNLRQDPEAAARVLQMELPWTLVPYEAGRQVTLGAAELLRLSAAGGAAAWTAVRADGWLRFWRDEVGLDGFYPFDLLAAAYAVEPALFDCAAAAAWVARDRLLFGRLYSPISLLVGLEPERPREVRAEGEVVYCPGVDPRLAAWSMERLTSSAERSLPPAG